jgi:DNA-binding transcriptional LysR family regulator
VTLGVLPPVLRAWRPSHGDVRIRLFEHRHADELLAAMSAGQADVAVGPPPSGWEGPIRRSCARSPPMPAAGRIRSPAPSSRHWHARPASCRPTSATGSQDHTTPRTRGVAESETRRRNAARSAPIRCGHESPQPLTVATVLSRTTDRGRGGRGSSMLSVRTRVDLQVG